MQILASMLVIMYRYLCWESHFLGARAFSRGFLLGPDKKGEGIKKKINHSRGKALALLLHFRGTFFSDHARRTSRRIDSSRLESGRGNVECKAIGSMRFFTRLSGVKNGEHTFRRVSHGCAIPMKIFLQVRSGSTMCEFILKSSAYIFHRYNLTEDIPEEIDKIVPIDLFLL